MADKSAQKTIKIIIVDDHPVLRTGLAQMLNQEPDFNVCGEAKDTQEALEILHKLQPDVAIVDITLEGISGLELIKMIRAQYPKVAVLVLSMHDESLYAERALRAGARGYVMKHEATDVIINAIRAILKGDVHVSPRLATQFVNKVAEGDKNKPLSPIQSLSDRELEVFTLIGKGFGTRQIAEKLCLSVKTVETYREHIKNKLKLSDATKLVRQAVNWVEGENL